jgi:hypothetical protein
METTAYAKNKDASFKSWWKRKTQNKNPNHKQDGKNDISFPLTALTHPTHLKMLS